MKKNKDKNIIYTLVIIFIIFIVFIFIIYCFKLYMIKYYISKFFNSYAESYQNKGHKKIITNEYAKKENLSYYRCSDKILGKITENVFNSYNINKSDINKWDIYVPCGYNFVEAELKKIKLENTETNNGINSKNKKNKFIFGINGCDTIVSKNKIWETLVNCYGRNIASTLMPESYVLNNKKDMDTFIEKFNNNKQNNKQPNKQKDYIYILKKNLQRKEGLKLTTEIADILEAASLNYKVVQKYMNNLYLINARKVNLRIYVLVVIKNNNIYFYLCKNGKCIYTNKKYNDNDLDFESNITSYHLDMNVYKENPRSFNELKKYMNAENFDILFNNIYKNMEKICSCISKNLYQSDNIKGTISFQLFGADVIFDIDLNPYLLEMNKGPDMSPRDDIDRKMKTNVQEDMFKIVGIIDQPYNEDNSFELIYKGKK